MVSMTIMSGIFQRPPRGIGTRGAKGCANTPKHRAVFKIQQALILEFIHSQKTRPLPNAGHLFRAFPDAAVRLLLYKAGFWVLPAATLFLLGRLLIH